MHQFAPIGLVSNQLPAAPTVLGTKAVQLPIGGTIRPGIKILTQKAEKNAKARDLYEEGRNAGKNFDKIEAEIKAVLPELEHPLRPANVPYFSVRADDFPMPEIANTVLKKYGEDRGDGVVRLYRFPVIFAVDSWQAVMPHTLKCWASGKLKYWAEYEPDGEARRCMMYGAVPRDPNTKRVVRIFGGRKPIPRPENGGVCEPEKCPEYQIRQCNLDGKLLFIIPGIPSINLIALPTRSFYSMDDIRKKLEHVAHMRGGRISGYLLGTQTFWLTKVYKDVTRIDDDGNPIKGPAWLINLEADIDLGALLLSRETHIATQAAASAAQVLEGKSAINGEAHTLIDGQVKLEQLALDERAKIKQMRADIFTAMQQTGITPALYDQYAKTTWRNDGWGRTCDGLMRAAAHLKEITEPRSRLQLLLQGMGVTFDRYDEYARHHFHQDDWSLTREGVKRAIAEVEEFSYRADDLIATIENELALRGKE